MINNNYSVTRSPYLGGSTAKTPASKAQKSDFSKLLERPVKSRSAMTDQISAHSAPTIQKEVSPLELYEQMRDSSDLMRSHKVVNGVKWTDETLAVFVRNGGREIDTSKTVNWNATGEHTLSEAELSKLREKYDVENLSGQNFYDLMADLSDLNAISAEDIHGMFLKQAPPMGLYPSGTSSSGSSFGNGNIVNALKNELDSISQMKDFLLSDDFWLMNPSANKDDHLKYMGYLDFRTNSMNKLDNIFSSIRA